jgi:hypothetical protein
MPRDGGLFAIAILNGSCNLRNAPHIVQSGSRHEQAVSQILHEMPLEGKGTEQALV